MRGTSSDKIRYCYQRATECRERALRAIDPQLRLDSFTVEDRWIRLAHSYELAECVKELAESLKHLNKTVSMRTSIERYTTRLLCALVFFLLSALIGVESGAQTLEKIKSRGSIVCGVNPHLLGFSKQDERGTWSGFDVDFCRALAAGIFDDAGKVQYVPLETWNRLPALQEDVIDILSRNTTWSMSREAALRLNFSIVTYFDGQGFLVRRRLNVLSSLALNNPKVCVQDGTTSQWNMIDYFERNNIKFQLLTFRSADEARSDYENGQCDVLTSDLSQLHSERLKLRTPDDHAILSDIISKEPRGPVVRFGDDQWLNIVKWTHFAMINAEELGVSSVTIDEALKSNVLDVKHLIGTEGYHGESIGLTKDWAARIIKHVGNYGEVYERNVGSGSELGIPRGLNRLWTKGGIQYAPPLL